jgi:hypothetical protein
VPAASDALGDPKRHVGLDPMLMPTAKALDTPGRLWEQPGLIRAIFQCLFRRYDHTRDRLGMASRRTHQQASPHQAPSDTTNQKTHRSRGCCLTYHGSLRPSAQSRC